jgi:GrpB-like predicted nucleotidyltransferase (UPF0157 family)
MNRPNTVMPALPAFGLEKGQVRVEPYNPEWPKAFLAEKALLEEALTALGSKPYIEHVGSTAVQKLRAKPIVDIVVGFRSMPDLRRGLALMAKSGRDYVKAANQPGMLFMASGEVGKRSFHYHLVVYGTPAWRKLMVFRDYLRRHPGVAKEYGDYKAELATVLSGSRADYMAKKRPMLRSIMQRGFAEEGRRRLANAIQLSQIMEEEDTTLRVWWKIGKGMDPSSPPSMTEAEHWERAELEGVRGSSSEDDGRSLDPEVEPDELDPNADA